MQYYKDNQNSVFAYSNIQTPKDGLIKITEQEALELAEPEPTLFERIAEAQAPFIEEQALAKKDFLTANIEGDEEWKAEVQAEYQASIVAMKEAVEQARGGE